MVHRTAINKYNLELKNIYHETEGKDFHNKLPIFQDNTDN